MEINESSSTDAQKIVDKWLHLQKIIKEEITLNEISIYQNYLVTKQQQNNIESLKSFYYDYYNIRLKIRETFENNKRINGLQNFVNYELTTETEKTLLEAFDPIQKLLFLLRNNNKHLLLLIENLEINKENSDTIVDLIGHQFYENLLIQDPEHEELLILIYLLLKKEIDQMNSARVLSFLDEGEKFIGKLLKSYTKRQDLKTFLTMILGNILLEVENHTETCLDLDIGRIASYIKDKKSGQVQNKSYNAEKFKQMIRCIDHQNLVSGVQGSNITRVRDYFNL
jgi:hypothetical protein